MKKLRKDSERLEAAPPPLSVSPDLSAGQEEKAIRDAIGLEEPFGFVGDHGVDLAYAELKTLSDPEQIAAFFLAEREKLCDEIRAPLRNGERKAPSGTEMARRFSDLTDAVIGRLFELACERIGETPTGVPLCVVATGGYGRRELCPYSDIDITFIPLRDGEARTDQVVRHMFQALMDIGMNRVGLEVGYAYRLLEDCGNLDLLTISGLLDARLIVGSERLFIQFEDAFWNNFNATDFIFAKLEERTKALAKHGMVPYHVEPHLKEGPGGLRDLQTMVWLLQARHHLPAARVRGERVFQVLQQEMHLTEEDCKQLATAKEHLFQVRNALHALCGAERDVLVVTRQEEVAHALGYGQEPASTEAFMAQTFTHLATIRRFAASIFRRVEHSRLILGIGLDCKHRQIVPANDALIADDLGWILWIFEVAQKYQLEIGEALEPVIIELLRSKPEVPADRSIRQVFTRILSATGKVYPILQKMADLGVLGWLLPEFGVLMNLIPYDSAHEYTVGQHTLYVIKHLEALLEPHPTNEELFTEMRRLLLELPHPEWLMLAALLHDCGKAIPDVPHTESGESIARTICKRLEWDEEATETVCFLVKNHLLMAETSRLRDLDREQTIADFVRVVDDVDRLNMLFLLTYADTRAVGEGVWTPVKGHFLRTLWLRALDALYAREEVEDEEALVARAQRALLRDTSFHTLPTELVQEHIQAMPTSYLLNQPVQRIAAHIEYVRRVRAGEMVIAFEDEPTATYSELTVCTYDDPQPGLLSKIALALFCAGVTVHAAQVLTRVAGEERIAIDTLWVDYRGRHLLPGKRKEVTELLKKVVQGETLALPTALLQQAKRMYVREVRRNVEEEIVLIEVAGEEQMGALYWPAAALARLGWNIQSARISTWQGEARAVFYVQIPQNLSEIEIEHRLSAALQLDMGERSKT
ncbi:HD domain-containing protein [Chthonomonas calidirosea]|uniref:[protein-PII] uridylyltransferase family protein n=1 Tax=Chthonomonas calidirosea TaxID=454171 RepID=UPI0006ECB412|nr:HD domain-containing protein [Chthonomonas calidirosea]CEK15704.1 UTP--GlnB (protein PII) uridylyltransferase, GlnD [Chthonomonas calidirosea]